MSSRSPFLMLSLGVIAASGCTDKSLAPTNTYGLTTDGPIGTTSGTTGSPTTGVTVTEGASVSGLLVTAYWTADIIDEYDVTGTETVCTDCFFAFEGEFTGGISNFNLLVTIVDLNVEYGGYAVGLIYGADDLWGYSYSDGEGFMVFNNYQLYTYYGLEYARYYYGGYFYY